MQNAPARRSAGRLESFLAKARCCAEVLLLLGGFLPVLADEALGRRSEGLDDFVLGDATLFSHNKDGLGLGLLAGLDLDGLDTCDLLERRTDAPLTTGSSDTREGGLILHVTSEGDAKQHNRQKGDKVLYFHCSRTDGNSIQRRRYAARTKSQSLVALVGKSPFFRINI